MIKTTTSQRSNQERSAEMYQKIQTMMIVGDTAIEGVTITLTDVDSGATNTRLQMKMEITVSKDLEPGDYTVSEDDTTLPETYVDVNDEDESDDDATDTDDNGSANNDSIAVTLAPGEDDEDNNFVEEQLGTISGNVSEDTTMMIQEIQQQKE